MNRVELAFNYLNDNCSDFKYSLNRPIDIVTEDFNIDWHSADAEILAHLLLLYSDESLLEKELLYSTQVLKKTYSNEGINLSNTLSALYNSKLSDLSKVLKVISIIKADTENRFEFVSRGMMIYLVQKYDLYSALLLAGYIVNSYGYNQCIRDFEEFLFLHQNLDGSFGVINPLIPSSSLPSDIKIWRKHVTLFSLCFLEQIKNELTYFSWGPK